MVYLSREKYRLELRWKRIEHQSDGISRIDGAYLSGPALSLGVFIQAPDSMVLDFTPQHFKIVSSYHIARLSWTGVEMVSAAPENFGAAERILLKNVIIATHYENEISSLSNKDYIIIDTSKHDDSKMSIETKRGIEFRMPLVYESYIVKETGEDKYA